MYSSYAGQARVLAKEKSLSDDAAQVLELAGQCADHDETNGEIGTKMELMALLLQRATDSPATADRAELEADIRKQVAREIPTILRVMISSGSLDTMLEEIDSLTRRRKEAIGADRLARLAVGDKILVSDNVRPKLLAGAACEVIGFEGNGVKVVLLVTRSDKWRAGKRVTLPRTLIGDSA